MAYKRMKRNPVGRTLSISLKGHRVQSRALNQVSGELTPQRKSVMVHRALLYQKHLLLPTLSQASG